jgi:hypothetical protein
VALGKMASSLLFGYAWQTYGATVAMTCFAIGLLVSVTAAAFAFRIRDDGPVAA